MRSYTKEKEVIDLSQYNFSFSLSSKVGRVIWGVFYWILFRPFKTDLFKGWRAMVLRLFGAKIGRNTCVESNVKIWAPWNLEVGSFSSIGPKVDCYNQGKIKIGNHTIVSQKSYICASSHDFQKSDFPLILCPVEIGNQVWIAADAFIGPGAVVEEGAVVGARASVFKKVDSWTVVGGNPAKKIKSRVVSQRK